MTSLSKKSAYKSAKEREQHKQELSTLLDTEGVEYHFVLYKGIPVSPFPGVRKRILDYCANFRPRQTDVWVCAYVKSGTHWVNEMAHMLLRETTDAPPPKEEFMLERMECRELEKLADPRLMNTHLQYSQLPSQLLSAGKVIFVTRDIRDAAVSLHYHERTRTTDNLTRYVTTWQAYLDTFCKGLSQNGAWFDYIKGWHEGYLANAQNSQNLLHLSYESMLADHRGTLNRLADFLLSGEQRARLDAARLDRVQRLTEFEHMRRLHSDKTAIQIYRRGKSGGWRDHFSDLDLFNFKAKLFDPLSQEDQQLFLRYAGMTDWS